MDFKKDFNHNQVKQFDVSVEFSNQTFTDIFAISSIKHPLKELSHASSPIHPTQ